MHGMEDDCTSCALLGSHTLGNAFSCRYGSDNAGVMVHNSDPDVSRLMALVGEHFHLAEHPVRRFFISCVYVVHTNL